MTTQPHVHEFKQVEGQSSTQCACGAVPDYYDQPQLPPCEDSPRLKEFCRVTTMEVKMLGFVAPSTSLEMIEYMRELEAASTRRVGDEQALRQIIEHAVDRVAFSPARVGAITLMRDELCDALVSRLAATSSSERPAEGCMKHCGHDPILMKGDPADISEGKPWCMYNDEDGYCGHVCTLSRVEQPQTER